MSKIKDRTEIEEKFKWNTKSLFSSDEDWHKSYKETESKIPALNKFKNNLTLENLFTCLDLRDKIGYLVEKLYVYANLKSNEDSRNSTYQSLSSMADNILVMYSSAISFIDSEILKLNEPELLKMLVDEKFKIYAHYIEDLLRNKKHILPAEQEEILAKVYDISSAPDNIFSMLNDADVKFKSIKDKDGNDIEVTHGKYTSLLESTDRKIREQAFKSYYEYYYNLKNTLAATYTSSVKNDIFSAKIRNYASSLELALDSINVPIKVYKNLIETVEKFLPLLHKYIDLRKKLLGVEELHYYDLYTPIVKDCKTEKLYDEAKESVLEALKPLGNDYINNLKKGFEENWIDVYENMGKRSGAYAWGAYGVHPFVSLNYDNSVSDMFTLAHEMGHAMHSYYTWENQPYIYGNYTIFVAEVASTVNEALLMSYLLNKTTDKTEKMYLINYFMEQFRGTLFRQTMFAEFEMIVHEKMENNEPQTFESLCEIYKNLNIKYYGKNIVFDEEISWEWSRIPHFYNAFYVYQYATGYSCAIALSDKILNENSADKYIQFLKSGSSNYSTELLKLAGVDITEKDPIEKAMHVFEKLILEMESLYKN